MWLAYASLAALCFGLRGILYQWTSQKPLDRNVMLLGVYLSGAVLSLAAAIAMRQVWSPAVWMGIVMGFFSFVSNASMFRGFSEGKASLVAVFTALTPVVVAALSYVIWRETLNAGQAAAFAVIVAGIVIIRYSNELSWTNLQGVHWALLAMVTFGITDVASKQAMLWQADKMPTLFIMYATGALLFGILTLRRRLRVPNTLATSERAEAARQEQAAGRAGASRQVQVASRAGASQQEQVAGRAGAARQEPVAGRAGASQQEQVAGRADASLQEQAAAAAPDSSKVAVSREQTAPARWTTGKTIVWGGVVGLSNIFGMIFILPAFERGVTGLVSAVVATNVLLILLYVRLVLKERWSAKQMIGIGCALAGVLALRLLE